MDPSPPLPPAPPLSGEADPAALKQWLRARFRRERRAHVAALPAGVRALILSRPPAPVAEMAPEGSVVGLYYPSADEAPALGWARWLAEHGRTVALPAFTSREAPMHFRAWANPWDEDALEADPFGGRQVADQAATVEPTLVVVPLVAFTAAGDRLGQGGGHYDRWLAAHPKVSAIGLAWDCQLADALPAEAHDRPLAAVVTPSRIYTTKA